MSIVSLVLVSDHGSRGRVSDEFHTPASEPKGDPTALFLVEDCARSRFGNALMQREFLRDPPGPIYLRSCVVSWSGVLKGTFPSVMISCSFNTLHFPDGASKVLGGDGTVR
jgi:hypothetical protein